MAKGNVEGEMNEAVSYEDDVRNLENLVGQWEEVNKAALEGETELADRPQMESDARSAETELVDGGLFTRLEAAVDAGTLTEDQKSELMDLLNRYDLGDYQVGLDAAERIRAKLAE